ncbi:MAG: heparinase II/III-family protein, partial [Pacificimonas sp.]
MAARGVGAGAASGLQRVEAGQAILAIDAGPPPDQTANTAAHAGALAFELSDGDERIVANIGGVHGTGRALDPMLAEGVRMTAAHSTLTLADTNQSLVDGTHSLGPGVDAVEVERRESEEGHWLALSHDGYRARHGLTHEREIFLDPAGRDLRGQDRLTPQGKKAKRPRAFAIRFHLTPGIDVSPTADGRGAVLKTKGGRMWQFKQSGGTLALDDSLWIGEDARALATRQLVVTGDTDETGATVKWRFNKLG